MSCCGCFEGLSGGSRSAESDGRGRKKPSDGILDEDRKRSAREIEDFTLGLDFISKVPLFKSLPMPEYPALAKAFKLRQYSNGQAVIKQGDIGDRFFCIKKGKAKVMIDGTMLNMLGPGDYFGELALLHNTSRNATIEADGNLECQELSQQDFDALDLRNKLHFKKRIAMIQTDNSNRPKTRGSVKTQAQAALIREALRINVNLGPVLKGTSDRDTKDIVEQAFSMQVTATTTEVITQGDLLADLFYVVEEGTGEAIKDGQKVASYGSKNSFGGLALLYQAPRAATVRMAAGSKLWCIPRGALRAVLQSHVQAKVDMYARILGKVKCLDHVSTSDKKRLGDALVETTYYKNEAIITEGDSNGRCFFILQSGDLTVTQQGKQVTTYQADEGKVELPYFGERALITDEPRAASVCVVSEKATLLVLDRDVYLQVVQPKVESVANSGTTKYSFDKLKPIGLLGCGGFGKVTLVQDENTGLSFALKALSKGHIVREGQQQSVTNEKRILRMTHSPFLVQVAATFNQKQHLMFLLEPALGGELFTIYIKHKFNGNEKMAMFYSACVLRGLEHLHERFIIYRDMKPENLLLDTKGYCKIADFGLAKFVIGKTFTTCGTPDYFAPELLKGCGHSLALDWWTLGILIYEFMKGVTPFQSEDPSQLFSKLMKGIDCADFHGNKNQKWPSLVKALCKLEPSERLAVRPGGTVNVATHTWYTSADFSWKELTQRTMVAPWDPNVTESDAVGANFDAHEEDAPPDLVYKDPGNGWDADFEDVYGPSTFD